VIASRMTVPERGGDDHYSKRRTATTKLGAPFAPVVVPMVLVSVITASPEPVSSCTPEAVIVTMTSDLVIDIYPQYG
jgi:hypothetical protein